MRFAQVTGALHTTETGYRIEVTLDTRTSLRVVRNEHIPALMLLDGKEDADWTVDQLTQETIGTTLAEEGWEAVAHQPCDESGAWSPPVSTYLVRG
ncbi:MAG: hypothetical protein R2835_01550 [Thermomicrobiales bacterium]